MEEMDGLIFGGEIRNGLLFLKRKFDITAGNALTLYSFRYNRLRESKPEGFSCLDEEYWKGFPS